MATGGGEFGYEDPDLDNQPDHDDDDDEEQEVDRTQPFQPGAASTPYHGGETIEMKMRPHEHAGLPETSSEEIPLLGGWLSQEEKDSTVEKAKDFIRKRFPKVDFRKLGLIGFGKKRVVKLLLFYLAQRGVRPKFSRVTAQIF